MATAQKTTTVAVTREVRFVYLGSLPLPVYQRVTRTIDEYVGYDKASALSLVDDLYDTHEYDEITAQPAGGSLWSVTAVKVEKVDEASYGE